MKFLLSAIFAVNVLVLLFSSNICANNLFDAGSFLNETSLQIPNEQQMDDKIADASRTSEWTSLREQKSQHLTPNKNGLFDKFLLSFKGDGGLGTNYKGIYPRFSGISTGSGFSPGIRYWRRDLFGTPLEFQMHAAYSLKSYQLYSVQFGKIMKRHSARLIGLFGTGGMSDFLGLDKIEENLYVFGTFRFRSLPQEDFYGEGPDSLLENRTDFAMKDSTTFLTAAYKLHHWMIFGAASGYMKVEIDPGRDSAFPNTQDVFDDSAAAGLFDSPEYFFHGGSFVFDFRDNPGNPHRGFMFGMEYARYEELTDLNFDFSQTRYDARGYLPLGSEHRVLAGQFYTSMINSDSANRVPFFMQETLGGPDSLRGFSEFRFRDDNLIFLSAEYRWEASPFWELALFYDAGKVFPKGAAWNLSDLEKGYGFGMRFKLPSSILLRFDIGHGREGTEFYIKIGSASF